MYFKVLIQHMQSKTVFLQSLENLENLESN